jgi:small subunit ribosomal protein S6
MSEKENQNPYETVYILRPDLTDEGTKKTNDKVAEVVGRFQGQLEGLKDLGKRPLAYQIAKQTKGHYFQLNYRGSGRLVEELERYFRLSEEVLRFLTIKNQTVRGGQA